jgi:pyruvate dehydrogenase E1 component alpha subunit
LSQPSLLDRYSAMVRMRHFEEACFEGLATGEIHGELHTGVGQEGIAAGMIGTLRDEDALVSTHRNHCHAIAKGVSQLQLLAEIYEKSGGLCGGYGGHMHPFDPQHNFSATGIVGSSLPVALGYAYAFWLAGGDNLAVGLTGEGGTNTGAFHECLNLAAAWKLPYLLVVENNEYAISVPVSGVSAAPAIAERACAYGIWGRRVDGTDVEVVAAAFAEAAQHARSGQGPALLEATCSRFRGHYEGDLDLYRSADEKERMLRERDPIARARQTLLSRGEAAEAELDQVVATSRRETAELLAQVRAQQQPPAAEARRHVFVEAPA